MYKLRKAFSVLAAFILLFSMMAPSLAKASETSSQKLIEVDLHSEKRTLNKVSVEIVKEKDTSGYSNHLNGSYDSNSKKIVINHYDQISSQSNASDKVMVNIYVNFTEDGKQYAYIDQQLLTVSELEALSIITVADNLQTTHINNDSDLKRNGSMSFVVESNDNFTDATFYSDSSDKIIAIPDGKAIKLSYMYTSYDDTISQADENNHGVNVLVYEPVTFSGDISIRDAIARTVKVSLTGDYANLSIGSKNAYTYSGGFLSQLIATPATYKIMYEDISNTEDWNGLVEVKDSEDNVIKLPTTVETVETELQSTHTSGKTLDVTLKTVLKNGNFEVSYTKKSRTKTVKILNGTKAIDTSSETNNSFYSHASLDMANAASGTYDVVMEVEEDSKTLMSNKVQIPFESKWQPLKGTTFTFEDADNQPLNGSVTIYDARTGSIIKSVNSDAQGEFFIPNASIIKDREYIAVLRDSARKIAYVQSFIGQATGEMKFTADQLKDIPFDSSGYETESLSVELGNNFNKYFITNDVNGWKIASNEALFITWQGNNTANDAIYSYYKESDLNTKLSLKSVKWTAHQLENDHQYFKNEETKKDYKTINTQSEVSYIPSNYSLVTKDEDTSYSFKLSDLSTPLPDVVELDGTGYYSAYSNTVNINYSNDQIYSFDVSGIEPKLVYEVKASDGTVQEITSNSLTSISFTNKLTPGLYEVKLKNHNLNRNIVNLSVNNLRFYVPESSNAASRDELPESLYINENISYFDNDSEDEAASKKAQHEAYVQSVIEISIYGNGVESAYYRKDRNGDTISNIYTDNFNVDKTYKVIIKVESNEQSKVFYDIQYLTGKELQAITADNALKLSSQLIPFNFDLPDMGNNEYALVKLQHEGDRIDSVSVSSNSTWDKVIYLPAGDYSATAIVEDGKSIKVYEDKAFSLAPDSASNVVIEQGELYPISFKNNGESLSIYSLVFADGYEIVYGYDPKITQIYYSKGNHESITVGVANKNTYESPWGYKLKLNNVSLTEAKTYEVNPNEISGAITNFENDEENNYFVLNYEMKLGEIELKSIEHSILYASESQMPYETQTFEGQPVRSYYVDQNYFETVNAAYTISDETGKVLEKGITQYYSLGYVYHEFQEKYPNGTYKIDTEIPMGPNKNYKLSHTFKIGVEDTEHVSIESPSNQFRTAENTVNVKGQAYKNADVTVKVVNTTTNAVLATKQVTATSSGTFDTSFDGLIDGTYQIIATNGSKSSIVAIVVDKTPPAKATNVTISKLANGLKVDWTGATDAKQYRVVVKENGVDKITSEILTSPTYTITTIKPGAAYSVEVESYDDLGNKSISDASTYTVPAGSDNGTTPGGSTGGNSGTTPGGNTGSNPETTPEDNKNESGTPETEQGNVEVDASTIEKEMGASNPTVTLTLPALTKEVKEVNVSLEEEATKLLTQNNKTLQLTIGDVTVDVPADVLKQAAGKDATFTIAVQTSNEPTTTASKVSSIYSFTMQAAGKVISQFDQPITISIPVNAKDVKDASKLAAFYVNHKENRYEFVVSNFENGQMTLKTKHFSDYVVLEGNKTFSDITNHWGKTEIEQLASKSIINGKTETKFGPNDKITRAEFAVLIARALNLQTTAFEGKFKDVANAKAWYALDVEAASRAGIITGYEDGAFKANANISREQMATMIIRAIQYMNGEVKSTSSNGITFADANTIGSYAKENVSIAAALGVVNGSVENGKTVFKPKNNATRAEAAKMLVNMLKNM